MTAEVEGPAPPGDRPGSQAATKQLDTPSVTPSADIGDDRSPLRQALDTAIAESNGSRLSMKDLTVLTNDPFRLDTPQNHKIGEWLADTASTLGLGNRKIHNRGLHYMILGQPKPDGSIYVSDEASWNLLEKASKFARWLGYLPFDQIVDQRNDPPTVRIFEEPIPAPYINVGIDVDIPAADDIIPKLGVDDFTGTQPYKLVIVGEKSSLDAVLGPIAAEHKADLYLPTGDISDTLIYQMAKIGSDDGRPVRVLYFADCDPSGWNMGVVIARKLQAFKVLHFPELEFEVHRAALTPDQVREFDLPSTPLKEKEARAGEWRAAWGFEQTEIDALATLRPELLRQVARAAIAPFFDSTLDQRVFQAKGDWLDRALAVINDNLDGEHLGRIRAEAAEKLEAMQEQIDALNGQLQIDVDDFDLPAIEIPEARSTLGLTLGLTPKPLLDSGWSFVDQCRALIDSKAYRIGGAS
jgi:hypothetical protein